MYCAYLETDRARGDGTLPPAVREWAGLPNSNPTVTIDGVDQSVAEHNDGRAREGAIVAQRTFKEIAQAVREQL